MYSLKELNENPYLSVCYIFLKLDGSNKWKYDVPNAQGWVCPILTSLFFIKPLMFCYLDIMALMLTICCS
jgi:hypothetical protein